MRTTANDSISAGSIRSKLSIQFLLTPQRLQTSGTFTDKSGQIKAVHGQGDHCCRTPTQSRKSVATAQAAERAMVDDMTTEIESMKLGAQQTLDELFAESLIPFKLSARVVESIGQEEYIVRFHDSRLYSVDVSWQRDQPFSTVFRTAILDRVTRLEIAPRLARTA